MITEQNVYGPFSLCHLDLHYNNILVDVDGDYDVTGIIEWSNAHTVPFERFALIPEFIPPPGGGWGRLCQWHSNRGEILHWGNFETR